MPAMILDGTSRFGVNLEAFYRRPELVQQVARRGILIPPKSEVATDAPPGLARVNALPDGSSRWIVDCPDCNAGVNGRRIRTAEYVWLAEPLMFCTVCGNAAIGSLWRPVTVPAERKQIEQLLLKRPDPTTRNWDVDEALEQLRADNASLLSGEE